MIKILPNQCKKPSRKVKPEDVERVKKEAKQIFKLCWQNIGRYPGALALAHCQVDHDDPLRYFVLKDGVVVVNPRIVGVGSEFLRVTEGCLSYAFRSEVSVKRYSQVEVSYSILNKKGEISKERTEVIKGLTARIFQHEIDHMNGIAIY